MKVLDALTADGSSVDFDYRGVLTRGHMNLYVAGSLGGGTLTLEAKLPDDSGYVPIKTITAVGMTTFEASPVVARLTLSGAMAPNVSAWVEFDTYHTRDSVRDRT